MLYVILGENTYKSEQELRQIIDKSKLGPENIDASALDANTLADIMRGGSLFSEKRLVVLKRLSDNKLLLDLLATWADDLPDDTTLVVVEPKLDKRTKAYKSLVKSAKVISAQPLTERDHGMAEEWLRTRRQPAS